jgi:hypothetical protein
MIVLVEMFHLRSSYQQPHVFYSATPPERPPESIKSPNHRISESSNLGAAWCRREIHNHHQSTSISLNRKDQRHLPKPMPCMKHRPLKSVGAEKTKDHDSLESLDKTGKASIKVVDFAGKERRKQNNQKCGPDELNPAGQRSSFSKSGIKSRSGPLPAAHV